jgi:hypothetical protein
MKKFIIEVTLADVQEAVQNNSGELGEDEIHKLAKKIMKKLDVEALTENFMQDILDQEVAILLEEQGE